MMRSRRRYHGASRPGIYTYHTAFKNRGCVQFNLAPIDFSLLLFKH